MENPTGVNSLIKFAEARGWNCSVSSGVCDGLERWVLIMRKGDSFASGVWTRADGSCRADGFLYRGSSDTPLVAVKQVELKKEL